MPRDSQELQQSTTPQATASSCAPHAMTFAPTRATELMRLVNQYFTHIDLDGNGRIEERELNKLLKDPTLSGEKMQTVVALKTLYPQLLTLEHPSVKTDERKWISGAVEPDPGITQSPVQRMDHELRTAKDKELQNYVRSLFEHALQAGRFQGDSCLWGVQGPEHNIQPDAIQQRRVANCWFGAALSDIARIAPEILKSFVQENKNGTFTVTLPGYPNSPQTLPAPTPAEQAYFGGNREGTGFWVTLLQRAHGMIMREHFEQSAAMLGTTGKPL